MQSVAKLKGMLVMLSLTKVVQIHDPSKLLRIICSEMMLLGLHKIFKIVVMNFFGTIAPLPVSYEAFWLAEFSFPQLQGVAF